MEDENKIRKVMFHEATIIAAVVTVVIGWVLCYADLRMQIALLQQDVGTIKSNELVHLKVSIESIENRNATADERQNSMELKLTKILTILGKE